MSCYDNIPMIEYDILVSCDGNPHSTSDLKEFLERAVDREKYESAAIYRDEINRRENVSKPKITKVKHKRKAK